MTSLRELLRSFSNGSATVEKLERAITDLQQRHDVAVAELAQLPDRRRELLLAGDDTGLAKLRDDRLRLEDQRDGAAAALEHIRAQLQIARDKARKARWGAHAAAYDTALAEYMPAARTAIEKFDAVTAAREAALRDGFQAELQTRRAPPNLNGNPLLAPDLLDTFEQELERVLRAPPSRPSAPPAPKPPLAASAKPERNRADAGALDQPPPRKKRTPRRDDPKADDVLVEILRNGAEINGGQCVVGDRVAVSREAAEQLVRQGAADFVPAEQRQPFPRSDNVVRTPSLG